MIDASRLPPLKTLLGEQGRNRRYRCPVHGGEGFNVAIYVGKDGRERAHCYSACGDLGDAIGLTMTLERCDFPTALRSLGIDDDARRSSVGRGRPRQPSPPSKPQPEPLPRSWNDALERIVRDGETGLWGPHGVEALAYLRKRRINDETIRRFRLGFLPGSGWADGPTKPDGKPSKLPCGMILLPWFDWEERPCAIRFRAPSDDVAKKDRWRGLGSCDGLYPSPNLLAPGMPVFLVEGLMDALSVIQEAQGRAVAVSPGSATASLGLEQDALRFAPAVYVVGDADEAGEKAASAWLAAIDHAQRLTLPGGFKDANDALRGEFPAPWRSLKAWLEEVLGDAVPDRGAAFRANASVEFRRPAPVQCERSRLSHGTLVYPKWVTPPVPIF